MNIGELTGLAAVMMPIFIVGIIVTAIVAPRMMEARFRHRKQLLELELERKQFDAPTRSSGSDAVVGGDLKGIVLTLQEELSELRRTSTEYDMSIHSNMEHMMERIRHLEQQIQQMKLEQHQQVQP